jgi:hypothetical protein
MTQDWHDPEKSLEDARDILEEQKKSRQDDDEEEPIPDTICDTGTVSESEDLRLRASGHKEF